MNLVIICARYEQKAMGGQIGWIFHFVIFVFGGFSKQHCEIIFLFCFFSSWFKCV
ncbi:hypothetical protein K450DRAFT_225499 [Umbelopsis ramanniana AG]|uniref:Uncharacterized protein n=1 Tax=Umbelopsis ramanniana AG TaxID=1314678 RepID=A0AAD5EIH4_UMBRA|nr:uncharacterized protein K450DRAFT_225499 [Umbelopsis ramanniana AG]KAI8582925.1 hypothetical protein K450DRAFT_225499 [Umbelopsis ramanniana AG]